MADVNDIAKNIPYVGAGIGLVSSLFGESEADIQKRRQQELLKQNEMYRQRALARANVLKQQGIKDISKETTTQLGRSQSDVARRAAALGRSGDTEAMLLPVTSEIGERGGRTLEGAIRSYDTGIEGIQGQYDTNAMNIQSDIAASPIAPSTGEELLSIGSSAIDYLNQDRYLKALEDINNPQTKTPITQDYSYLAKPSLYNRNYRFGG
jgi:hypothetical protein